MTLNQRLSAAAHSSLSHANPLTRAQMTLLAYSLAQRSPRTVLDIGSGPGTFSIDLARICPASITAIDVNPYFLARAQNTIQDQSFLGQIDFRLEDASHIDGQHFDAVVCMGASQAFGTPREALERCITLTKPGGTIVFADLVWSADPPDEFLAFLGTPKSQYWPESEAEAVFRHTGLSIVQRETASHPAWQTYEAAILQGRLEFAETLNPEEAEQVRSGARAWAEAVEQYGQYCFGFEAYLAIEPQD